MSYERVSMGIAELGTSTGCTGGMSQSCVFSGEGREAQERGCIPIGSGVEECNVGGQIGFRYCCPPAAGAGAPEAVATGKPDAGGGTGIPYGMPGGIQPPDWMTAGWAPFQAAGQWLGDQAGAMATNVASYTASGKPGVAPGAAPGAPGGFQSMFQQIPGFGPSAPAPGAPEAPAVSEAGIVPVGAGRVLPWVLGGVAIIAGGLLIWALARRPDREEP